MIRANDRPRNHSFLLNRRNCRNFHGFRVVAGLHRLKPHYGQNGDHK